MDAIIGAIAEFLKCLVPPLCRCVQYHRKLHENARILKTKLGELNCRKEDIERRLQTECHPGKLRKAEVDNWLQNIERINSEALEINQNVKEVKYFSRACLGKLVLQKSKEVDEHYQRGGTFDSLVIDASSSSGLLLPTKTTVGETTTAKTTDKILEYLMGNELTKIGVCGMGGAGKTMIMTSINNKLLKETNKFTNVIWITVSQPLDLMKLKGQIVAALKGNVPSNDDEMIRAGEVLEILEGKRFVLILDDMWEKFDLAKVGIPEPTKSNGCKLVITTRSRDVCKFMGCKIVEVKPLPEVEALNLFLAQVGDVILRNPYLEKFVKPMVRQCAGLPLAIVTVAGCMREEADICEWRNALDELSQNIQRVKGMETEIPRQLQFSYDRLKDERIQHCFLYCALYPKDFAISKEELIGYWIAAGLVDERSSMQAKYDKGHVILNRLVSNYLLESADDGKSVKMHDLIRDMALQITSQSPLFMVEAGVQLREFPSEEEWKGNLEKVSLMWNEISEIHSNLSPNCHTLSTLLLQGNPFEKIPESFFLHMPSLRILDLSYTNIKDLPNSVCELRYLTTLLLNCCEQLQHVPSLAKLSSLWRLELRQTMITEVPAGIEMLENLRILDLSYTHINDLPNSICELRYLTTLLLNCCEQLRHVPSLAKLSSLWKLELRETIITEVPPGMEMLEKLRYLDLHSQELGRLPTGILPKLFRLQKLRIFFGSETSRTTIEEVTKLRELEIFEGHFCNVKDFNQYVKGLESQSSTPQNYQLLLGPKYCELQDGEYFKVNKHVELWGCKICEGEDSISVLEDVQRLGITDCHDLIRLSDIPLFNKLYKEGGRHSGKYSDLKVLRIFGCQSLKKLFSPKLLRALQNLEEIEVERCFGIEEIIRLDGEVDELEENNGKEGRSDTIIFTFPKLKKMSLGNLPELKSICSSNGVIVCDSLEEVNVLWCRNLKRLPLSLPLPAIKEINVERCWWESLEWDDPNTKNVLQPYCWWWGN